MAEMTKIADILSVVSYVAFALAVICAAIAVYFWFRYDIPAVAGDLSGRTARKSIAQMRETNEKKAAGKAKATKTETSKGITARMPSLQKGNTTAKLDTQRPETGLLESNKIYETDVEVTAMLENGTVPLEQTALLADETALLENGTVPLEQTALLADETALLADTEELGTAHTGELQYPESGLVMLEDIVIVHTDEKL